MKIAIVSYWTCPLERPGILTAGGLNIYIRELANALGSLGHTVDIFTREHKQIHAKNVKIQENVHLIHFPSHDVDLYKDSELFGQSIVQYIRENNTSYNVIHTHYYFSGLVGIYLQKTLSIPHVFTFHTSGISKRTFGNILDQKRIIAEKEIVSKASRIIVSTSIELEEITKNYSGDKAKIDVVAPGVNHRVFKHLERNYARKHLGLSKDKKYVLFVGRIDPIKGIHFLIQSFGFLMKEHPEFSHSSQILLLGGDVRSSAFSQNKEVKKIKSLIEKNELECCVKFLSSQPHSQLPFYYSAADVVVMPSTYESFGMVVLEAMATAAAVIATNVGGLKYLISDKVNGRLFKSGDVKQLANILWEVLSDASTQKKLGEKAQQRSFDFCWSDQADKIVQSYRKTK